MENKEYIITPQGSLGLLALGHIGIQKWREAIKAQNKIQESREKMVQDQIKQHNDYNNLINKLTNVNPQMAQGKIDNLTFLVQELSIENNQLKEKVKYLEDKLKILIMEQIQFKRNCTASQN